ncbi:hypothetical protein HDU81_001234 [Chytriomyces hyalinus]|nr:hypothetical protein HDU81_001234 [Chytriomyces hyalinus]
MGELFGGAIKLAIPPHFADASQFRQVPDNQEVFVSSIDNSSVIVELLEAVDDTDRSLFHFNELADTNDAGNSAAILARTTLQPVTSMNLQPKCTIDIIHGIQHAAKFNTSDVNSVHVLLAVVHLPQVNTDLLISINKPVDKETKEVANATAFAEFVQFVGTLRVDDWGLFA